ncbi:mechanosensitive ion channel [Verticiella sediminum]|uniref:Mechanosensitive ion channel n=1 Tax=Verticiella sediminum TaxID=1247510 RepID=A0A556ANN4_9BURK|nr:mechanosensitive ion channel domain-containing protein [Verticiella sediminum]TSH94498.1 mechanosensitive ion channel [Verticiella sediminum]
MRNTLYALLFVLAALAAGALPAQDAWAAAPPAASAPVEPADTAPADAEAPPPAADTDAPAAEATPAPENQTLVADGLLAQLFGRVEVWFAGLSTQVAEAGAALSDVRLIGQWWQTTWNTDEARAAGIRGALMLLAIVAVGLAAEALASRLLRRARRVVAAHAEAREQRARERIVQRESELASLTPAVVSVSTPEAGTDIESESVAAAKVQAGMLEPDAVTADTRAAMTADAGAAAPADASLRVTAQARLAQHRKSLHGWGLLGRLPWAVVDAVLSLLPLVAFLAVVSLGVTLQGGEGSRFQAVVMPIFNSYVAVRIALAVVRLMLSPDRAALRLAHVTDATARHLFRQALWIFTVAAIGFALGEVLVQLGAAGHVRTLIMKTTSLIVCGMVVALVLRTRESVRTLIRGERADEAMASLRAFLAEIYPYAAVAVIVTFWVVWALGVANGFQRAVHFLMATTAVLAASRLLWILITGAIDRSFENANTRIEASLSNGVERYHGWLRLLVNVLIGATTVIALLQVWGFNAISWFDQGTVGRRLLSAGWTIGIAAVLAIIVWEAVSLALRRRIDTWSAGGDVVRAARLRTLVPMIRTLVLIAIALVVVFTALTELGVNVAPLLAGASIIGVAIGFGSQKLVQDFITGIFLLMENAMQVGDNVTVAGVSGTVEYLSIRTVRLRAGDGSLHVIPFSSVSTVNNVNRGLGNAPVRLTLVPNANVPATYDVLRRISEQMQADERFGPSMLAPLDIFGVDQIDGAGVTIAGQIRTTDKGRWPVQREFNRRVLEEVKAGNIMLANPRETLLAQAPAPAPETPASGR